MQVLVKKPHIRLEGEIPRQLLSYLEQNFGEVQVIENEDEELVEVTRTEWCRNIRDQTSPGENLRLYRTLHGLTQEELGTKVGNFSRQNISNMERGHKSISKSVAKKLAELFDVSVDKFI